MATNITLHTFLDLLTEAQIKIYLLERQLAEATKLAITFESETRQAYKQMALLEKNIEALEGRLSCLAKQSDITVAFINKVKTMNRSGDGLIWKTIRIEKRF